MARFQAQGYAVDVGENEVGINGIARAIVNGMGEVAAAIVAGHSSRLTEEAMEQMAPDVIAAADTISDAMGGGEPRVKRKSRRRQR